MLIKLEKFVLNVQTFQALANARNFWTYNTNFGTFINIYKTSKLYVFVVTFFAARLWLAG